MRHSTTILGLGALCSAIVCTVAAADPSGATTSDRAREASLHAAPVGQARLIRVRTTIQAAVDTAKPGDVVLVPAGTYHENVVVSTDGVSLVGLTGAVLDGAGVDG